MRWLFPVPLSSCLLALMATPAAAQTAVPQVENVRVDYAQVLNVEPVYETLRATRMERQCDPVVSTPQPETKAEEPGRWSRMMDSVKGLWSRDDEEESEAVAPASEPLANCRMVPVRREFQRPIAYDVDYVYKGVEIPLALVGRSGQSPAYPHFGHPLHGGGCRDPLSLAWQGPACEDTEDESEYLPLRKCSPDGLGHDFACSPTGNLHLAGSSGRFRLFSPEPSLALGFFVFAQRGFCSRWSQACCRPDFPEQTALESRKHEAFLEHAGLEPPGTGRIAGAGRGIQTR